MMTRLMTWFIELRNRFNELRLSKILTIYVLNWSDDLISWHFMILKWAINLLITWDSISVDSNIYVKCVWQETFW